MTAVPVHRRCDEGPLPRHAGKRLEIVEHVPGERGEILGDDGEEDIPSTRRLFDGDGPRVRARGVDDGPPGAWQTVHLDQGERDPPIAATRVGRDPRESALPQLGPPGGFAGRGRTQDACGLRPRYPGSHLETVE
nr:hypothetical protein [Nocardia carnea]